MSRHCYCIQTIELLYRLSADVDRFASLVHIRIDNRHGVGRLAFFLVLHHCDGGIWPLVPPFVTLAIFGWVFLGTVREVNATERAFVADILQRCNDSITIG